jgi:hypothetical protein
MSVAPSSARARKTPRGLASGVVARRSKRVLSRLFRLKKKLPCQIFGLMGSQQEPNFSGIAGKAGCKYRQSRHHDFVLCDGRWESLSDQVERFASSKYDITHAVAPNIRNRPIAGQERRQSTDVGPTDGGRLVQAVLTGTVGGPRTGWPTSARTVWASRRIRLSRTSGTRWRAAQLRCAAEASVLSVTVKSPP